MSAALATSGRLVLALALTATLLSGCGRKDSLERPGIRPATLPGTTATEDSKGQRPAVADKPFFLDPLL